MRQPVNREAIRRAFSDHARNSRLTRDIFTKPGHPPVRIVVNYLNEQTEWGDIVAQLHKRGYTGEQIESIEQDVMGAPPPDGG